MIWKEINLLIICYGLQILNCPTEITQLILEFLEYKKDVLAASLVCNEFNKILEKKKS